MSISESLKQLSLEEEVRDLREKVEALENKTFSHDDIIKTIEKSMRAGSLHSVIKLTCRAENRFK
jgi:hypothetical protein